MKWLNILLRCCVALVIIGSSAAIAMTLQTAPGLPRGLWAASLVVVSVALAALADTILKQPKGAP